LSREYYAEGNKMFEKKAYNMERNTQNAWHREVTKQAAVRIRIS